MIIQILYIDEDSSLKFTTKTNVFDVEHERVIPENEIVDESGNSYIEYINLKYTNSLNNKLYKIEKVIGYKYISDTGIEISAFSVDEGCSVSIFMQKEKNLFIPKEDKDEDSSKKLKSLVNELRIYFPYDSKINEILDEQGVL